MRHGANHAANHGGSLSVSPQVLGATLITVALALLVLGLGVGSTGLGDLWQQWQDPASASTAWQIVRDIRLPRTLGAWCAGALLGLGGALAQGLFRNPLADPFLLGSAAGASLGVTLAMAGVASLGAGAAVNISPLLMAWFARLGTTGAAFAGAMLAVLLTLQLARGVQHTLRLLLAGVIVGVVLGACKELITLARPDLLLALQGFNLGSAGFIGWDACGLMLAVLLLCTATAWVLSRTLDALSLGEATAASLGLPLAPLRAGLIAVLALATGTAVAHTGLIAFIGLAAPHVVRAIVKTTHAPLMLLAALMGGCLLMAADLLARSLIAPQELPVGVLTAVLGGSYLLWLMHRNQWQDKNG